jgi:hypothetical protein
MKKILILLITIPLLSLNTINNNKFIGKWIGESKGEIGYISFDKEGYAVFEIQGQIFGGKEFVLNGKKGMMTYKINNKVNPIEIDLIVTKIESKEEMKLLCIANFKNENEMEFAINFENKRPVDFNTEDSMILKREK